MMPLINAERRLHTQEAFRLLPGHILRQLHTDARTLFLEAWCYFSNADFAIDLYF